VPVAAGACAHAGNAAAVSHTAQIVAVQPRNIACFARIGRLPSDLQRVQYSERRAVD
jgi:hypothetical protein